MEEKTQRGGAGRAWSLLFVVLTFGWSWLWWIPIARLPEGSELGEVPPWKLLCLLAGAYGPSLVGLLLTWLALGGSAVRRQLGSLVAFRSAGRWTLVALTVPWLVLASGVLVAWGRGAELGLPTWSRWALLPVAVIAAIPFGPLGEEFGWRGFLQPRLLQATNGLVASFVIGALWTAWHIPLFWAPAGTTLSGGPINVVTVGAYLLSLVSMSCLATWLMNRSGQFLLLAVAMHVGFNVDMPLMPFRTSTEAADQIVTLASSFGALGLVLVLAPRLLRVGGAEADPSPNEMS